MAGADADLDLAAIAVDTGDAPAGRVGPRAAGCGRDRRAGARAREPRRPRACARRSGTCQRDRALVPRPARPPDRRLARAHARRCRAARRAARWSTPSTGCSGSTSIRLEGGLILALPADAAMQRRAEALAAGEGDGAAAARHRARARARRAADARRGRAARARRPAGARRGGRQPRRRRRASSAATCSSASTAAAAVLRRRRCSMRSRRADGALRPATVLRGTEERTVGSVPLQ